MNLTQFENPISGEKRDILRLSTWWSLILGGIVLAVVWGLVVRVLDVVRARVPGVPQPPAIFSPMQPAAPARPAPAVPAFEGAVWR